MAMGKCSVMSVALLLASVLLVGTAAATAADTCENRSQAVQRVDLLPPAPKTILQSDIKLDPAIKAIAGKFSAVPWARVSRTVIAKSCAAQKGLVKGVGTFAPFLEKEDNGRVTMTEAMAKSAACLAGSTSRNASLQAIINVLDMTSDNFYDILVACKPGSITCQIDSMAAANSPKARLLADNCKPEVSGDTTIQVCPDFLAQDVDSNCETCDNNANCPGDMSCLKVEGIRYCFLPDGTCGSPCFPGDAIVVTPAGPRLMASLRLGDRVLASRSDGSTFFDEVYMNGHKDGTAASTFVRLETASGAALRLTPGHHVQIERPGAGFMEIPSEKAQIGDLMRVQPANASAGTALALESIVARSLVPGTGLFNPYTLNGNIVVDGVAASVHSPWVLDGAFEALGVSLPVGYQTVFAPIRALYKTLGVSGMRRIEWIIDAVADAGNKHGATGALRALMGVSPVS